MDDLALHVQPLVLNNLSTDEKNYLSAVFNLFDGYPNMEQLWQLLDEQWLALKCDHHTMDDRITSFYKHPVWILNGLFAEADRPSIQNRRIFADLVAGECPSRVADFGGGFGTLARMIGERLPNAKIEVVDPFPHPAAIALTKNTPNVSFVSQLSGEYDFLVATDVFEHVPDPIGLAAETASHLRIGGHFLIANCFAPVILCHLPQLFHFRMAWDAVMRAIGLEPGARVGYGRVYCRRGAINVRTARNVAECGQKIHKWTSWLPRGQKQVGSLLMKIYCKCN